MGSVGWCSPCSERTCSMAICFCSPIAAAIASRFYMWYWDRDGLALWYKRLEAGTFEWPRADGEQTHVELDGTELAMLLGGVSLGSVQRRRRFKAAG